MVDLLPLQLGIPGGPELLVILLIAVLLFGANKIPKLARSTGEAMGEFQKGREEVEQELQQMRDGATSTEGGAADATAEPAAESTGAETTTADATAADTTTADAGDEDVDIADAETEDETR
jgi:sec-independent protein translocase protein TatA